MIIDLMRDFERNPDEKHIIYKGSVDLDAIKRRSYIKTCIEFILKAAIAMLIGLSLAYMVYLMAHGDLLYR